MMTKKCFASVRTKYYKADQAFTVLDHSLARRNGFTSSPNVHRKYSSNNLGIYLKGCNSSSQALEKMCENYKKVTGKKVRKDFNLLFEHIVVLSEQQYSIIEQNLGTDEAKKLTINSLKIYAKKIKDEFGFEPMSIDLHLDEGHYVEDRFVRNIHAHISFFNYDFKKKVAPLRHLMKKGKDSNLKSNQLNPNFEKMQDLVADSFKALGFERGESKNVTGRNHQQKEAFVKQRLREAESQVKNLSVTNRELSDKLILQKRISQNLSRKIAHQEERSNWLEKKIIDLNNLAQELEMAIKSRCKRAINFLSKKLSKPNQDMGLRR
tara:strand:+ start:770 stop:1735 length:966 start_codon:yes stop_codon:yes gene_type:complete